MVKQLNGVPFICDLEGATARDYEIKPVLFVDSRHLIES